MLDPQWYEGREEAFVKHTFIDSYMPDQIPKVVRYRQEFAYVDLFAGPWQSKSGDYSDTSFGIALKHMTAAKAAQARLNRNVRMVAHLVEKENFAELQEAVKRFSDIEVHCYPGLAEAHVAHIADRIPSDAFRFVVIDPKGVPDVGNFRRLITPRHTEVLLTFMFDFANRFAGSPSRMPTLESWVSGLANGDTNWRAEIARLNGTEREAAITDAARAALGGMGDYCFAPAITVDKAEADRPLYKLIYLTRHPVGLRVFRDAHLKALRAQAATRTAIKVEDRARKSGMNDLLAPLTPVDPTERSAREIENGEVAAHALLLDAISNGPSEGLAWKDLWPRILDPCVVTEKQLGAIAARLRDEQLIDVPGWTSKALKRPKDDFRLRLYVREA